jgi:hypothetical protein
VSVRIYLPTDAIHNRVLKAFYDGCPAEKKLVSVEEYKPSDIAVVFGIRKSRIQLSYARGHVIEEQRRRKLGVIVLETGYIKRGDGLDNYYAAGFGGLNGRANFRNKGMPDDRFKALGVGLKPYRNGDHVLLCAQVPWDASVDHVDYLPWLEHTAQTLVQLSRRPIVFRAHPMASLPAPDGCRSSSGSLVKDMENAHAVVSFNSNTGVDALLDGVPVFAFDEGSMVWGLCNRSLDYINAPHKPEREQWANDLAYCQWLPSEMAEGKTWRHLFRKH